MHNDRKTFIGRLFGWGWFKFAKCTLGIFLYSLAVNFFIVPSDLYTGGILGISQLLRNLFISIFDIHFSFDISSIIYYLINLPLFIYAYKSISRTFFVRTLFAVTVNTIFLIIIPIPNEPLVPEIIACVLMGGIIGGIGCGMTLSTGTSMGGTDIIGFALSKKNRLLTVANIGLGFNILVYGLCGLIYGYVTMIYSIISAVFQTILTDKNHMQNIRSEVFVLTKNSPEKMINFISQELNRDATYWQATGGFTKTSTYITYTVLDKYERMRLERHMHEFDKSAFMVSDDGVEVKGKFERKLVV